MSRWVLDASALLVLLNREPGSGQVEEALAEGASITTVNLSEVVAKLSDGDARGDHPPSVRRPADDHRRL